MAITELYGLNQIQENSVSLDKLVWLRRLAPVRAISYVDNWALHLMVHKQLIESVV